MQIKKSTLGGGMGLWIQIVFAQRNRSTLGLPVQARGGDWLPQATALHFPSSSCQWSECTCMCSVRCVPIRCCFLMCLYSTVPLCSAGCTAVCGWIIYLYRSILLLWAGAFQCLCGRLHRALCVFFIYTAFFFCMCVCSSMNVCHFMLEFVTCFFFVFFFWMNLLRVVQIVHEPLCVSPCMFVSLTWVSVFLGMLQVTFHCISMHLRSGRCLSAPTF